MNVFRLAQGIYKMRQKEIQLSEKVAGKKETRDRLKQREEDKRLCRFELSIYSHNPLLFFVLYSVVEQASEPMSKVSRSQGSGAPLLLSFFNRLCKYNFHEFYKSLQYHSHTVFLESCQEALYLFFMTAVAMTKIVAHVLCFEAYGLYQEQSRNGTVKESLYREVTKLQNHGGKEVL